MVAATPVDTAINPNNAAQRVVLWGNGRIDSYGGLPQVTDGPNWYQRVDQQVGVAIHITNWTTLAGYILDIQGGFQAFGGAPDIPVDEAGFTLGLPYVQERRYCDWSWNPSGATSGYVIDVYGEIFEFGGEPDSGRAAIFTTPAVKGFKMRWAPSKAAVILDASGAVWMHWDATAPTNPPPYFRGRDVARDLAVTAWAPAAGYVLTGDGAAHSFGGSASSMVAGPYRAGQDVARELNVLSVSNPTRLWQVHSGGQSYEYVASTPPTVTAGGISGSPAATVTDTTRPTLAWSYTDPQGDSQAAWELLVFTQAYVNGRTMTDPNMWQADALVKASGINRTTRGITTPIDLGNGTYRMYVRAKDTAGQWSAWSNRGWTQNVPPPATPTNLTATASESGHLVALSVSATTGGTAAFVRFESSDDAGVTWAPVVGADARPIAATVTATDRFIPLGVTRTYRAVAYNTAPRVRSLPSATATATVTDRAHLLHALDNPALGGRIRVQEPYEWTRQVVAGVFQGIGAEYPTVVRDAGGPKAARGTLRLLSLDAATWAVIEALAESASTLVYRDPFGVVRYCEVVGDWPRRQVRAAPTEQEVTPLRHMHTTDLPLVEVAPPAAAT